MEIFIYFVKEYFCLFLVSMSGYGGGLIWKVKGKDEVYVFYVDSFKLLCEKESLK